MLRQIMVMEAHSAFSSIQLALAVALLAAHSSHASPVFGRRYLVATMGAPAGVPGGGVVVAVVCGALSALVVLSVVAVFLWRRTGKRRGTVADAGAAEAAAAAKQKKGGAGGQGAEAPEGGLSTLTCLTFNDVQVATDGFKPDGTLSDKPHSSVHRAEGPNSEKWAVKRAKGVSLIGEHLFRNEVDFLAKVTHPNILSFLAFSDDCTEQILVFEFMANGSLASWLRPPPEFADREPLTFSQRIDIALNIADALCFLHSFSKPTIIHRDVVSDSVLLDENFNAKLGSLGLLKHLPGEGLWMRMAQKKGYLDPEYFQTFKVTAKCDVYSFGVVLLELLTANPPVIQVPRAETQRPMTLPQWATQCIQNGQLQELLDPRMPKTEGGFTMALAEKFAQIACECVAPLRKNRPEMLHVASSLRALKAPPEGSSSRTSFLSRLVAGGAGPKVAPASS